MFRVTVLLFCCQFINAIWSWSVPSCGPTNQITEWGKKVTPDNVWPEYPRPQMLRSSSLHSNSDINYYRDSDFSDMNHNSTWINLNGLWQFEGINDSYSLKINHPLPYPKSKSKSKHLQLSSEILVPFPVEFCLSGIGQTYKHLQYLRYFNLDDLLNEDDDSTRRVLLNFGAVDWQCSVYVNSKHVGNHTGGYDTFYFDITDFVFSNGTKNELFISVYDPSDDGVQPNGKQRISAITNPGGDTYTPSSGIWQTVWIEFVSAATTMDTITNTNANNAPVFIDSYKLYPTLDSITINVTLVDTNGNINGIQTNLTISVIDSSATDENDMIITKLSGQNNEMITIPIPTNSIKLWNPLKNSVYLYNMNISIDNSNEFVIGYFGLRDISLGEYNYSKPGTGPQIGIDRPGGDINGYPITLNKSDYNICWHLCNITNECQAWAYGVPNCSKSDPFYNEPMCWLKSTDPSTTSNVCRVSGAKATPKSIQKRPILNGDTPIFLAGWLDQSFWPDGGYSAPNNDGLKFDLTSIIDYGYNGVRLHQKVNPERWYYYADTLGIMIFQDMIQKYGGATNDTIAYFMKDLNSMINEKFNHPSILQWEIFNEGDCWGVFPNITYMVEYVRSLDSTRLVDTDSGGGANDYHVGDVYDVHDYPYPGDPQPYENMQYAMVGEYGGLGVFIDDKEWVKNACHTYKKVDTPEMFMNAYVNMTHTIIGNKGDISCVIYTQITDVELECDGYLNYDRSAKWNTTQIEMVKQANQYMIQSMWQ